MNKLYLNQLSFFAKVTSKLRVIPKGSQILYKWYVVYLCFNYCKVLHVVSYFNEARTKGAFFLLCNNPTRAQVASFFTFRDHTQIHHTK